MITISEEHELYSTNEVLDIIVIKLNEKNVSYTVEKNEGLIHIYLDKDNNFCCSICDLDIKIGHLKGYRIFNLAEGKKFDNLSINNAVEHIFEIMSNDLFQVEAYKRDNLCSVNQYIVVDGKKISCSGEWILHVLYFIPFIKKEIKVVRYRYKGNKLMRLE